MIVYCAVPIRGDRTYYNFHIEIINYLNSLGHTALSELNENFKPAVLLTPKEIFSRDMKWIEKSKAMIAEVSGHSLGVGFEIAYALYDKKIPVLALFNENSDNVSAMITGCNSGLLTIERYADSAGLKKAISSFLENLNNKQAKPE
jgi:2'-deoxynucleoside 5'-phosphate N-hydrolase